MEAYQGLAAHTIRQHLRENSLREFIDEGAPDVPGDIREWYWENRFNWTNWYNRT